MEWYGYTGKTLKIDLTEEKISILQEKEEDIRHFIGGMGMNTLLGAKHLKPGIDPFSPIPQALWDENCN